MSLPQSPMAHIWSHLWHTGWKLLIYRDDRQKICLMFQRGGKRQRDSLILSSAKKTCMLHEPTVIQDTSLDYRVPLIIKLGQGRRLARLDSKLYLPINFSHANGFYGTTSNCTFSRSKTQNENISFWVHHWVGEVDCTAMGFTHGKAVSTSLRHPQRALLQPF